MKHCPICNHDVEAYHELSQTEPYTHTNPFDGIMIYGAFSAPKETLCFDGKFLHFAFWDAENKLVDHRLVQLGVENPTTKSPSDEYMEVMVQAEDALNDDGSGINYDNLSGYDEDEWDEVGTESDLYNDNEDDLPF